MEHSNTRDSISTSLPGDDLLRKAGIPWKKSQEEAWQDIAARIATRPARPVGIRRFPVYLTALAAGLLILVAGSIFLAFYSKSLSTGPGERSQYQFSDGSVVRLNGDSGITWHPGRWIFTRNVRLTGEAYFEVSPGKRFNVISRPGVTTVLGTRFNIRARDNQYEVYCLSGKVRVESATTRDAVILQPDEQAILNNHGKLELEKSTETAKRILWLQDQWTFTGEPLENVIRTVEEVYQITLINRCDSNHLFTGSFSRTLTLNQVLDLVCTPFGYTFTQKADTVFEIHTE